MPESTAYEARRCSNRMADRDGHPSAIAYWLGGRIESHPDRHGIGEPLVVVVDTPDGRLIVEAGDWVIKGDKGDVHVCRTKAPKAAS